MYGRQIGSRVEYGEERWYHNVYSKSAQILRIIRPAYKVEQRCLIQTAAKEQKTWRDSANSDHVCCNFCRFRTGADWYDRVHTGCTENFLSSVWRKFLGRPWASRVRTVIPTPAIPTGPSCRASLTKQALVGLSAIAELLVKFNTKDATSSAGHATVQCEWVT